MRLPRQRFIRRNRPDDDREDVRSKDGKVTFNMLQQRLPDPQPTDVPDLITTIGIGLPDPE